jgi:hypothetical protein
MKTKISFGMKAKKKSPVKTLNKKKLGSHAFNATILTCPQTHSENCKKLGSHAFNATILTCPQLSLRKLQRLIKLQVLKKKEQCKVLTNNLLRAGVYRCFFGKSTLGRGAHKSVSWVFQSFFFFQYMLLSLSLIFKEIMET